MERSSALILALFYALIVANVDLLLGIDSSAIQDRGNYLNAANNAFDEIVLSNFGSLVFFFEQQLFPLSLLIINGFTSDSSGTLRVLIFFSAMTTTFLLLRRSRVDAIWFLPVVMFEWYAVNHVIAVRQGLAATVFLLGFFATRKDVKFLCYAMAPMIHSQFFLALLFVFWLKVVAVRFADVHVRMAITAVMIAGIAGSVLSVSLLIGFQVLIERYSSVLGTFSFGLGYLFWVSFFCLCLMEGRDFIERNFFAILVVIFYLTATVIFVPFSRVMQALIVPVMIAGFELTGDRKILFRSSLGIYSVVFLAYEVTSGWSVIID